jgi:hypothetical protein
MKMLKKSLFMLLFTCMAISGMSIGVFADSTVDTQGRHVIYTQADLAAVAKDMNANYILANDITLSGNWTPIGWDKINDTDEGNDFFGIFDGNGYTISGLNINMQNNTYIGLFAGNSGTIKNLNISVGSIKGYAYVGAVAGGNSGTISNVQVLSGGTMVAYNQNGAAPIGGLVGKNVGIITQCSAKVQIVAGYNYTGGLVGQNYGTISECFTFPGVNTDMISTNNSRYYAGGLVGGNIGDISDCYVHKASDNNAVCGSENVGGFAGANFSGGTITNCYANITYSATRSGYGDVGSNAGTVSNCYATNNNRSCFSGVSAWASIQNGLTDNGNWALETYKPVQLQWELNKTTHEAITLPATHTPAGTYSSDASGHWYSCTDDDGEQIDFAAHDYSNKDGICTVCGYECDHSSGTYTTNDGETHDFVCSTCGLTKKAQSHVDANGDSVCDVCEGTVSQPSQDYTVTFTSGEHTNAAFASVEDKKVTVANGQSGIVTLPAAPANSGTWVYDFLGWSDGNKTYAAGEEITVTGDVKLTAVWQLHSVNGDELWTIDDVLAMMSGITGKIEFAPEQKAIADRNGDGKLNIDDVLKVMDELTHTK